MTDALPRRNLGPGEAWGRALEGRSSRVAARAESLDQMVNGDARNLDAQLSDLQRQAALLRSELISVPVALQSTASNSNFGIGTGWSTVASAPFTVPEGKTQANIIARATSNIDWVAAQSGGGERFQWPFSLSSVSQEYGPSDAYSDGMHKGIDFSQGGGTPIIAPGSGVVTTKTFDSERGNYIIIDHGDGLTTWYYHLQAPSPLNVGSQVTKGSTVVGYVGTTGFSTGNHLHWETRVNGNHMNPRNFMDQYANSGSTSTPFDFKARLVIGGTVVREFLGSREPVSGDVRIYSTGGRTFAVTPGSGVTATLQLISTNGLNNPAFPNTMSSIVAFGVFS